MKKLLACILFIAGISNHFLLAQNEIDIINYIDKHKGFAIEEQLRTGVPAAITLAQGIHETSAGKSELATIANNHFGIKCKTSWTGETFLHDDDKKQECFRKYTNTQQSYIDHSDFLRAGSRYQSLFALEITDYAGWAAGLKKAGYATNPLYVKKLTDLVEKYNLQQYTYDALHIASIKPGEVIPNTDSKNAGIIDDPNTNYKGLKGFWAKKGETLQEKAAQYDIKYNRLLDINNLQDAPLPYDMFVFTEKKKKTGTVEFHLVQENENMHIISQKEAINLDNLYSFNNMNRDEEPLPGEQLSLQYRSYGKPKLVGGTVTQEVAMTEPESKPKNTEPVKESKPAATNENIIDVAKAKKVESILTGNPESKSEIQVTQNEIVKAPAAETKKAEPTAAKTEPAITKAEPEKVEKKIEKKPQPVMPKRYYNEKGVDDSVKALKERFDNLVYRPFERRVKAEAVTEPAKAENSKAVVKKSPTGITKEEVVKTDLKKTSTAKDTAKTKTIPAEEKKTNVEKTKTGIVRDPKKIEEDKKKAKEAAEAKKAETKPKQKTDAKNDTKKGTKEVLQKGAKATAKKTEVKKEDKKKTDIKKKDPKKK